MKRFKDRSDLVLYLWDYFYVTNVPAVSDEAVWAVIERATCRIRESEIDLDPPTPSGLRLRSARRVRNAARLALRKIEQLSVRPDRWVIDGLAEVVAVTETMIETLIERAAGATVH